MAPSVAETEIRSVPLRAAPDASLKTDGGFNKENVVSYYSTNNEEAKGTAKQPPVSFPNYLPVFDNETERYPPLKPFEHYEHGKDADPSFPDLLPKGKAVVDDLTPNIGAEVHGVQLSQLSNKGKDQLALYVAQRKVVGMYCYSPLVHR